MMFDLRLAVQVKARNSPFGGIFVQRLELFRKSGTKQQANRYIPNPHCQVMIPQPFFHCFSQTLELKVTKTDL